MATSEFPSQPRVKAGTQFTDTNVVSDQTQAGSPIPTRYSSPRLNDDSPDLRSGLGFGRHMYEFAQTPETSHSASFEDTAVWDKKAVLALGMFCALPGI